jgi:hypothetical protein
MKVVCINNTPKIYKDGSKDDANQYLTLNKVYDAKKSESDLIKHIYIEISDKGGFPYGHRWWAADRFLTIEEYKQKLRQTKLDNII